jgi:UDP-N-acetylmuramate dehydrogenase
MVINNNIISQDTTEELSNFAKIEFNTSLSLCTTFKTGGIADILIEPSSEEAIASIIPLLKNERIPFHVIGGGSNLLISDKGLRGAVVKISGLENSFKISGEYIYAGAALSKERFISEALSAGYGGVEFMAGIPGSIGGGIFMNAGTYMGSFVDILKKIRGVDFNGSLFEVDTAADISGYRKMNLPENTVITGGIFSLTPAENIDETKKCVEDIVIDRWKKHPMDYPSAGSVFKNPEGFSSWKLINDSGLKGYRIGGAMVSEKHTNFIVNAGEASSNDIYNLIRHIQETVFKSTGIMLETEIKIMGEFPW